MNSFHTKVILFFGALLLLILGPYLYIRKNSGARPSASPTPIQKDSLPSPTPSSLPPSNSEKASVGKAAVEKTQDCANRAPSSSIEVDQKTFRRFLKQKNHVLLIPQSRAGCLNVRLELQLQSRTQDIKYKLTYLLGDNIKVRIDQIEELRLGSDPGVLSKQLGKKFASTVKSLKTVYGEAENALFYSIRMTPLERPLGRDFYGVPPHHPAAKTVHINDLNQLAQSGALFFDIRSAQKFKLGALPKAVSYPLFMNKKDLRNKILSPTKLTEAGYVLFPYLLPKTKEAPILIYGDHFQDYDSYNAVTFFAANGYKNLYWFPGGIYEWKQIPNFPPEKISGARVISTEETLALLSTTPAPTIIDVRTPAQFSKGHLPGAQNLPYYETRDKTGIPILRKDSVNVALLQQQNETYDFTKLRNLPKGGVAVIYGGSPSDWRSYKAALWAASQQYQVYWFRNGWAEWQHAARLFPERFKKEMKQ